MSEEAACTIDSYESRIHCVDRSDGAVADFGREGEGPGEFDDPAGLERGPGGQVAAVYVGSARMTFFELDGTVVSETPLQPLFQPSQLRGATACSGSRWGFRTSPAAKPSPPSCPW